MKTRLLIIILLLIATCKVVDIAYSSAMEIQQKKHEREMIIREGWQPPPIPQCDKETWDRIREGCDNE
jgi:hypothetical protein